MVGYMEKTAPGSIQILSSLCTTDDEVNLVRALTSLQKEADSIYFELHPFVVGLIISFAKRMIAVETAGGEMLEA